MTIEKMKQWLEALEVVNSCIDDYYLPKEKAWLPEIEQAITSLRQAIAEVEKENALRSLHNENERLGLYEDAYAEQEPVAWGVHDQLALNKMLAEYPQPQRELNCVCGAVWEGDEMVCVPHKREWVGLTDEEYFSLQMKIRTPMISVQDYINAMQMVEKALKGKNT